MALYTLINPSDAYLFEAPSLEMAAIVLQFVSDGLYGATQLDDDGRELDTPETSVHIFLLGGRDAWFTEKFGHDAEISLQQIMNSDELAYQLADSLDSFFIGTPADLKSYKLALSFITHPEAKEAFSKAWNEERRSSINDIGSYAKAIAGKIRDMVGMRNVKGSSGVASSDNEYEADKLAAELDANKAAEESDNL